MTMPEKVIAFLQGGRPGAFCDDCITKGLTLKRRQEVASVTLPLSLCRGFYRAFGHCSSRDHIGAQEKLVIRAV